ncbi:hypothetical protein QQX98_000603 [Neonectria punicea]|uniref:Uncharacterized protein n=1 Tax=Neonectria punicea TaxID=979145 RepID=A0ABR1HSZ3_9HYPO
MGSQISSTSLPGQVSEAGAPDSQPTVTEKVRLEEQDENAHANKPPTDHRSTFLKLPKDIRNIIYNYAFAVEDGYSCNVSRGLICLADEPGYPPKLCSLASLHAGDQWIEDYLTEEYEAFKPYISRKAETWRIEINQLKYVCKQLHRETRGTALKINAGRKLMFHGTRTSGSSDTANPTFRDTGRISGMANFVHFYTKCSPEQQEHIRNVDIIELPLNDEQPRKPDYSRQGNDGGRGAAIASRTWVEHIMTLEFREAFKPRPLSPDQIEKRSFRRRCAELTGRGDAASKHLYKIYRLNPSMRVIARYNEWQDTVDREWIKRMCSYHVALRRDESVIAVSNQEQKLVRELVSHNGGATTSPSLDNLRMSSSVNFVYACTPASWYFMDGRNSRTAVEDLAQRKNEIEMLFEEGV